MKKNTNIEYYDVIIVGAGFSGLSAAFKLEESLKNIKILLFEADDEIGGRSFNKYLGDGTVIELGGQWIGFKHVQMLKYVELFNLKTYVTPPFSQGKNLYFYGNKLYDNLDQEFNKLVAIINKLTNTINLEQPWINKQAQIWDKITFQKFIDYQEANKDLKQLFKKIISASLLSTDANKVSLLQVLFYIASNGGFEFANSAINGAQNFRIVGGIVKIAQNIVKRLKQTKIILNQEVVIINDNNNQVMVSTNTNDNYYAKYCILALSPIVSKKIKFYPNLPKDYQEFLQSYQPGGALKIHFIYETQFWIKDNKSGFVTSAQGFITEVVDNSTPNSKKGILSAFIYGKRKDKILKLSEKERKNILINELVKFFGHQAQEIINYIEFNWADNCNSWTGGCFAANLKPNAWVKYGSNWKKPIGLIHFAGTETSSYFYGYFEGAVLSGQRVVNEIIKLIATK